MSIKRKKKLASWTTWICILLLFVLAIGVFSLCVGSGGFYFKEIIFSIKRGSPEFSILFDIRLPRIILGFAVGGALSLAGVILQGIFRNPLVEPYTLGISGGAVLGVTLNMVLGIAKILGVISLPISGFLGGTVVIIILYFLSINKRILKMHELLLCGVMISFVCSSLLMLLMAVSKTENLHGIIFWMMGSLEQPNMNLMWAAVIMSVFGLIVSYFFCFDLNALLLGEEEAAHLGINVEKTKRLLFVTASVLTGFSVSVAGIIGFVGLLVPHFVRMFVGNDYRILNISVFLLGGGFLVFCDALARIVIAPLELPVGVITGILGGTLFIYSILKKKLIIG
ncbi:MAG: iron ABC transporter permease [Candidatus Ratteibacteria bacterium]|nr:iron ABC transporter permease [Candidatus Ratteibacteria bacterium]